MALSATFAFEIAFTTAPGATPSWTAVTSYVRGFSVQRGRTSEFDQFPAGSATLILSNADRRFDPEYSAGPYYGDLLPRRRLRIRATYNAVTYDVFHGYIDGWPQAYDPPNDATVTVRATDAFKMLANTIVPSVWSQTKRAESPRVWYRLGEDSGTAALDSSGNGRHATYEGGATFNTRAGLVNGDSDGAIGFDGIDDKMVLPASAVPGGLTSLSAASYTLEFWATGDAPAAEAVLVQSEGGTGRTYVYVDTSGRIGISSEGYGHYRTSVACFDGTRHHVSLGADNGLASVFCVDGVDRTETVSAGTLGVVNATPWTVEPATPCVIDELLIYDSVRSAVAAAAAYSAGSSPWDGDTPKARIDRVLDHIDWPAADRDLDTGSAELMPAALEVGALEHIQAVETTEGGRLFISRDGKVTLIGRAEFWSASAYRTSNATFADDGVGLPYRAVAGEMFTLDDERIVNEARVRPAGGSEQVASDAASQTEYLLRSTSERTLEARLAAVKGRAEYLVAKSKDPSTRVPSITIKPESAPADLYPVVLGAELGYRYTVKRSPQGVGTAISKDVHLEAVSIAGSPGDVTFTWQLSPGEQSFWVWGTSTWETGDHVARWGY